MKRAVFGIICYILLAIPHSAKADDVSDQDMASRYLRAAQSGNDEAQFYLGALYSAGVGVPHSDQEAFRWLSSAANQGHLHAMLILSALYATGRGVERNNVEAYKWSAIVNGASQVNEFRDGSSQLISVLERRMSPDEIYKARSEAGKWRAASTSIAAPIAPPTTDYSRTAPTVSTPAVAAATPAPAVPTTPAPQPSKPSIDNSSLDMFGKSISKDDVDEFLKQMPGLRKKFGY